jgi:hypothetical protein
MSRAEQGSKRKHRACAVPLLGAAGLSLAGGASAGTGAAATDIPTQKTGVSHEITLGEEEISDVSLATFYVFDKENVGTSRPGVQLARGCHGCRGCGGCGGWRGAAGGAAAVGAGRGGCGGAIDIARSPRQGLIRPTTSCFPAPHVYARVGSRVTGELVVNVVEERWRAS